MRELKIYLEDSAKIVEAQTDIDILENEKDHLRKLMSPQASLFPLMTWDHHPTP